MKKNEAMQRLESLGTAQNRKVYSRHGVTGKMFGVSYANMGTLAKKIRTDHALAEGLWTTGNHDAQVLAAMIADPAKMTPVRTESWVKACKNYVLTDAFVGLACKTPGATGHMKKWIRSGDEWIGTAGWNMVSRAPGDPAGVDEAFLAGCIDTIESRIHKAKNRVRYSMNTALISIGCATPALRERAVVAARRIGQVEVDHGETGCKTPDAEAYIKKTLAHRKNKLRKKA